MSSAVSIGWWFRVTDFPPGEMNTDSDSIKSDDPSGLSGGIPSALRDTSGFQVTDWLSFGATTLLALVVYLLTLAPDVGLDNSGVWSTAVAYGGVSSPPGYPLWTLWAWVFTKLLPFSNIAWRVAVSSAVAGALACGVIALMVSRGGAAILEQVPDSQRLKPQGRKMAPGSLRLCCRNGFWFKWRFLAAGGHCCRLAGEHFIALPRSLFADALELRAGTPAISLCRCFCLWAVVDEQPDRICFRAGNPLPGHDR